MKTVPTYTIGINASFLRKPYTGIGQVTVQFLRHLPEMKDMHYIAYCEEAPARGLRLPKHIEVRAFLPAWTRDDLIRKIWWEKYLLPRKAERDGCDAFISLYQSTTILSESIRHIMVVHDLIPRLFPEYLNNSRKRTYQHLTEKAFRQTSRIMAVSRRTEKDLVAELGLEASHISVHYLDCDPIFKKPVLKKKLATVLKKYQLSPGYLYHGGGLEVRKNTETLLYAYQALLKRNRHDHALTPVPPLVISGKLQPELAPLVTDIEKLVKKLDLTPHVRILGFVKQPDLPALYAGARVFIYPSFYEGFGLPVLEAMSQGVPVITSKKSSLPEVGGDSVLYCNPHEPDDMGMVIRNILLNDNLRKTLSARGKKRAKIFSWEKFVEKTLRLATQI